MARVHIFKIGPLDGPASIYIPISADLTLTVVDAIDDVDGLRRLVAQQADATFVCSPDLADAGAQLGIASEPLSATLEVKRITIALRTALDPDFGEVRDPRAINVLLGGASDFLETDIITRWPEKLPVHVELRGDRERTYAGALTHHPHPGLVLFDEAATANAFALAMADERRIILESHDHIAVSIEPAPPYAAVWLDDFYAMDRMPRPTVRGSARALAGDEDALTLGGALTALSRVVDLKETMYATTDTPGRVVRTFVSPGEPWPFVVVP